MGVQEVIARYLAARLPKLEPIGQNMMSHAKAMRKWAGVYEEVGQNLVRLGNTAPGKDHEFLKREILKGLDWLHKNKVNYSVTPVIKMVRDL